MHPLTVHLRTVSLLSPCSKLCSPTCMFAILQTRSKALSLSAFTTCTVFWIPQCKYRPQVCVDHSSHQPRRFNESYRCHFAGTSSTVVVLVLLQQSGGLVQRGWGRPQQAGHWPVVHGLAGQVFANWANLEARCRQLQVLRNVSCDPVSPPTVAQKDDEFRFKVSTTSASKATVASTLPKPNQVNTIPLQVLSQEEHVVLVRIAFFACVAVTEQLIRRRL